MTNDSMARQNYQRWTPEAEAYLRKKYARHGSEYLIRGLARLGQKHRTAEQIVDKAQKMGLSKDPEWLKADHQRRALLCCERRGEDFNERQRWRALHPGESGWWGGKRAVGCNMDRKLKAELCKRSMHKPEVRERATATRRKTVARDKRRVAIGLDPLTRIANIGEPMTMQQRNRRAQMKHECGYVTFRGDRHIYYDDNTRRSEQRERNAEAIGLYVYHISKRDLFASE